MKYFKLMRKHIELKLKYRKLQSEYSELIKRSRG